jgi:hypothetical protein
VYGNTGSFSAERLIDLLDAFETFTVASKSARGDLDLNVDVVPAASLATRFASVNGNGLAAWPSFPLAGLATSLLALTSDGIGSLSPSAGPAGPGNNDQRAREALKCVA